MNKHRIFNTENQKFWSGYAWSPLKWIPYSNLFGAQNKVMELTALGHNPSNLIIEEV